MKYLVIIFLALGLAACSGESKTADGKASNSNEQILDPKAFMDQLNEMPDAQLVDVRTPEEFSRGYISGAVNIDFNADDFREQIKTLDKTKPVMVYCKAGGRSAQAAEILKENGFEKIIDLKGGMMAWEHAGMEVESAGKESEGQNEYSFKTFQQAIASKEPVIIDFYAEWCAPCKRMAPVFDKLALEFKKQIVMTRIDVDKAEDVSNYLEIESIPLIIVFKEGRELKRLVGEHSEKELRELVEAYTTRL